MTTTITTTTPEQPNDQPSAPWNAGTPNWDRPQGPNDWRLHISEEVRGIWGTFTREQRDALARQAHQQALEAK